MTRTFLPVVALLALLPLSGAFAGGFQTLPASAPALGLAGAVTSMSRDASAAWFNPGALGMLDSTNVSFGLTGMRVGRVFRSTITQTTTKAEATGVASPYLYAAMPLDSAKRLVVALAVNTPFAYDTQWPTDWEGRALVQRNRVRSLYVQPTVAYRISDQFSVGGGIMLAGADYLLERAVGEFDGATGTYEASGNGIGWNVGIKGRAGDAVSFGISYRSSVKVEMSNGKAKFAGIPSSQAFRFPASAGFGTTLYMPSQLAAGISNMVTEKLMLNFTFELTGWSNYDSLVVRYDNNIRAPERAGRKYEDAMAFRVGAEYQLKPSLAVRGGIYYDESPVRDQNITPDFPDANVFGGAVGVGYQATRHMRVDAAYTYGVSANRNASASFANLTTPAIAGRFRNNQHGGALNLSYSF
jgi:long-chain fatty acid transport protein